MANIDRSVGNKSLDASRGIQHSVSVVYGLPAEDVRIGGLVIKLAHKAGMDLTDITKGVFTARGHRAEVFTTPKMLVARPDSSLAGVYLETPETFISSQEVVDPETRRGSGRFNTTILTSLDKIQELDQFRSITQTEQSVENNVVLFSGNQEQRRAA